MSSARTIDGSSDESQPLLNSRDHDYSPQPRSTHGLPIGIDLAVHVYLVSREALRGYTYFLLCFVPLGIVLGALQLDPIATSILNLVAIIPLSALVSHASDLLSDRVGELIGCLINATFGNAVELIVGVLALSHGEIQFAQTMMIGSILSDILLVLGCCILSASWRKSTVKFNAASADTLSSLMTITAVALVLPTALYSTLTSSKGSGVSEKVISFSRGSATVLLIFYLLYLYFQLRTHSHLFVDAKQDEDLTAERRTNSCEGTSETTSAVHLLAAAVILILAAVGITVCTHLLLDSKDETAKAAHTTKRFIAAIMLPIASNAPEFSTVISTSRSGKTNYALGVIVGSILQIALFVIPLLVILGWIIQQPMTLYFEVFQTTLLFFSVLMVNRILRDGEYTYLHGFMLIELYAVTVITFYTRPEVKAKSGKNSLL